MEHSVLTATPLFKILKQQENNVCGKLLFHYALFYPSTPTLTNKNS